MPKGDALASFSNLNPRDGRFRVAVAASPIVAFDRTRVRRVRLSGSAKLGAASRVKNALASHPLTAHGRAQAQSAAWSMAECGQISSRSFRPPWGGGDFFQAVIAAR